MLATFAANTRGRDFVVGDLHGCFSRLIAALSGVRFDARVDRLFSVGDLVDRGAESERALEFLDQPWFHAVRGNHEQMALDYVHGRLDVRWYAANGGAWFIGKTQAERMRYVIAFQMLPIAIEVEVAGRRIGIVHADCPVQDWSDLAGALMGPHREAVEEWAMWSRHRITDARGDGVAGVYAVVVGHTPVERVTSLGNVLYIDTGAVYGRCLTLLNLAEVFV